MIKKEQSSQSGMILVSVFITMGVLVIIGIGLITFTLSQYSIANRKVFSTNAVMVAEAGIEQAIDELNQDDNFDGYAEEQELFNNAEQGRGTFSVEVEETEDSNTKIFIAKGRVYRHNQSDNPISERSLKITAVGTTSGGYSVHTGPGGLILGGSANITNSNVFVNGTLTMNGAARIGTNAQPLDVNVAYQACPTTSNPGPSYPSVCSTGQPISLAYSTFIYGSVCATNQVSTGPNPSGNIRPGNGGQGLITGCDAEPVSTPTYDKAAQVDAVTTTDSGSSNNYVCNSWPFDRNWPDSLQLNGNVNIGGSCDVTINGDVYITGNLTIGGASRIRVSDTVGGNRPKIIVDGNINVGGSGQLIANNQGTGIDFISFRSNASCGSNCTSLSGTELKNTQNLQTVSIGGAANLPGMTFQAYWGRITITGSGSVGAAAGQTVDMSGAGTVTFGTELSSGQRSWTITSYQDDFD